MSKNRMLILLSVLYLFFFVFFSILVNKGALDRHDYDMTLKVQKYFPEILRLPFSIFSVLGSFEVTTFIWLLLLIYVFYRRYYLTFFGMFMFFISIIIEFFGKILVYHPGPPKFFFKTIHFFTFPSHYVSTNYSYPSGHSIRTAFLVFFILGFLFIKPQKKGKIITQIILITFLFFMLVSRIYLGEHWATDVFGGLLLGTGLGILSSATLLIKNQDRLTLKTLVDFFR